MTQLKVKMTHLIIKKMIHIKKAKAKENLKEIKVHTRRSIAKLINTIYKSKLKVNLIIKIVTTL